MLNLTNINVASNKSRTSPNNLEIFNKYLLEIKHFKSLSREEELALFKKLERKPNDKKIIDKLCKHNLLFVVSVAKIYASHLNNSMLSLEDLINEGNVGLCIAVKKFDYKTGNKFITYAVWHIRAMILEAIKDNVKTIRVPHSARDIITNIERKECELEQKLCRTPTTLELFESEFGYDTTSLINSVGRLDDLRQISGASTSLNVPSSDQDKTELGELVVGDTLSQDTKMMMDEHRAFVDRMLQKIPYYAQCYLIDFYGLNGEKPLTLKELADKYQVTFVEVKACMSKYTRFLRIKFERNKRYLLDIA